MMHGPLNVKQVSFFSTEGGAGV